MVTSRTGTAAYKAWRLRVLRAGLRDGVLNCPECGVDLDYKISRRPNSAEPDHIVPYANGGRDTLDNGRVICRRCNQSLGKKSPRARAARRSTVQTISFE